METQKDSWLHNPNCQTLAKSAWPSRVPRLQSWAHLADSLLAELMIQVKVKCSLIMHPICSQGKKHGANSFAPGDVIMHRDLSHMYFSQSLHTERATMGTCGKGYFGTYAFTACLWSPCFSVGSLEPSRVWGNRSQSKSNIPKTCNHYLAAVNWRCKCSEVGNNTGNFLFCHRWTHTAPHTSQASHIHPHPYPHHLFTKDNVLRKSTPRLP